MTTGISPELEAAVAQGISLLKGGGVVAFPTDTVYGLGAAIDRPAAIDRIYTIKERPGDLALPVLLGDISRLDTVAAEVTDTARRLAAEFWPGALTLIVRKSDRVPDAVTAGAVTVAVRVPDHPVPLALVQGCGVPVSGTSANLSGHPSPRTAAEVRAQLGDRIDLVIDGGACPGGRESTIVDVTGPVPVVRRVGAIPLEKLQRVCPETTGV
jgi:L-threonylcarbamoyladenylate synthase